MIDANLKEEETCRNVLLTFLFCLFLEVIFTFCLFMFLIFIEEEGFINKIKSDEEIGEDNNCNDLKGAPTAFFFSSCNDFFLLS